jgi:hypothetical protein
MTVYPGIVDYSDLPLLPPWFIPGWTSQNQDTTSLLAPVRGVVFSELPAALNYIQVTGNFDDGTGAPLGGYFTFMQSNDLLVSDPTQTPTAYYRVPKRLVGTVPTTSTTAYNESGSGKIHLIYGILQVMLLATDNPNITVFTNSDNDDPPSSWNYTVKEYFYRGKKYQMSVPSTTNPVDINSLITPGTIRSNHDWDRGY